MGSSASVVRSEFTEYIELCEHGNEEAIIEFIDNNASIVFTCDSDCKSALYYACIHKLESVALKLLTGNSLVMGKDYCNRNIFTIACKNNMVETCNNLLKTCICIDVLEVDTEDKCALLYALDNLMISLLIEILNSNKHTTYKIPRDTTCVIRNFDLLNITEKKSNICTCEMSYSAINLLIKNAPFDTMKDILAGINNSVISSGLVDSYCVSPLLYACKTNKLSIVMELLNNYGDHCNIQFVDEKGCTSFYYACYNNMPVAAEKMIQLFGSVITKNFVDKYHSITPLMHICNNNMLNTLELLIPVLPKELIYHVDKQYTSALTIACARNHSEICLMLFKNFDMTSSIMTNDMFNSNPLMYACKNNMSDVAHLILANKCMHHNLGTVNKLGYTILICACMNKMDTVVLEILKYPQLCNLRHKDIKNHSALHYLYENEMFISAHEYIKAVECICNDTPLDIYNTNLSEMQEKVKCYNELSSKINNRENTCLICYNSSHHFYCSYICNHVINVCPVCIDNFKQKTTNCPLCRKQFIDLKRVYLVSF